MYHNGNTMSNTSNPPTSRGSTTPVTMATAFCPIEEMPPTLTGAQLTQVSHSQVLNLLHKSRSTSGSITGRPTPMRIVDQPVDKSESSAGQTLNQPVTPVSFVSTTQVRMDTAVPLPVGQGVPPGSTCMGTSFTNHKCSKHSKCSIIYDFTTVNDISYNCKVLKWGLFRLPAYVANVMKVFAIFSGCNTCWLIGFYCLYVGEA